MEWLILIFAGLFEVSFVITMKLSDGFKRHLYTVLTFVSALLSLGLLSVALKDIPVGTGYAVWTGIGAAGSVLIGMLLFKEKKSFLKLLFLCFIIVGVAGLKIVS